MTFIIHNVAKIECAKKKSVVNHFGLPQDFLKFVIIHLYSTDGDKEKMGYQAAAAALDLVESRGIG